MIIQTEIVCKPSEHADDDLVRKFAASSVGCTPDEITGINILKRSIDARGRQALYRMQLQVFIGSPFIPEKYEVVYPDVRNGKRVIIVGAGPAGLFAALHCIQLGLRPVLLERGKEVRQRRHDLAGINREGIVNAESNYCFGEGGAGTYSDGKLYTRATKRGDVGSILRTFVAHGASPDILIEARPHIGTNKLPGIVTALRQSIIHAGGELHFNTRVENLVLAFGKIRGVKTAAGESFEGTAVILATGHSARDIFYMLHRQHILIEPKPFALGVRIEHPQIIVDQAQYHCPARGAYLPPAYYNLVEQVGGSGVFSFCMCPGGIIAPCATGEGEVVVNGWSPSKRNNPFANSGTVVQVELNDIKKSTTDRFALLQFQQEVEQAAFRAGGGLLVAPAQRMVDFVDRKVSADLPANSYLPGTRSVSMDEVLPSWIAAKLRAALPRFGQKMKGYFTNEAILVGVESRTSSPVKVPRDKSSLQHPQVEGLFPCGEGAGYAGGIISAAIDGINCAEAAARYLGVQHFSSG